MSFVGIIANDRDFKNIRKVFERKYIPKSVSIIEINEDSIENMRNINFETLIFCRDLKCNNLQNSYLEKICNNASYIVINNDFVYFPTTLKSNTNIITYGLNKHSTVTVSSISENGYVISLQKSIIKNNNKIYEIEEKSIKAKNTNNYKLYKNLITYIIKIIYKI